MRKFITIPHIATSGTLGAPAKSPYLSQVPREHNPGREHRETTLPSHHLVPEERRPMQQARAKPPFLSQVLWNTARAASTAKPPFPCTKVPRERGPVPRVPAELPLLCPK